MAYILQLSLLQTLPLLMFATKRTSSSDHVPLPLPQPETPTC